ncbi:MAG: hypothetical protein ACRD5G_05820 [Candidatus Acidiferrales bacterium]
MHAQITPSLDGKAILVALAVFLVALGLVFPVRVAAQDPPADPQPQTTPEQEPNVKQTIEFGGRITDVSGQGRNLYRTFANYNEGITLFEYTLDMRSRNHQGIFWDDFNVTSFGYGADPNYVTRLRAYKNNWYNFGFTYRRDKNFWDYNLLANPLNPATPVTDAPPGFDPVIRISPHQTQLVRRMYDYHVAFMPQSPIRVRLAYGRNISEGPSLSSFHEGTDVFLFQPWKTTLNTYQVGVDFKLLPRTNFSFDQFWHEYKGDTSWVNNFQTFALPTGVLADGTPFTSVDLGLIFNTPAGQPCATPFQAGGVVNPTCNAYQLYNRAARVRTSYPSSRVALQSNYFRNFDFAASFTYTSTDSDTPIYNELYNGLVSRTRQRQFSITGPAEVRRISASADFGITWQVTNKFALQDSFNFQNFRVPGTWAMSECSFFGTTMAAPATVFNFTVPLLTACPTLSGAPVGTPNHATSSPADEIVGLFSNFLGEDSKTNTFMVRYDFNRRFGARLGYRHRNRDIVERRFEQEDLRFFPSLPNRGACAGQPLLADGSCAVTTVSTGSESLVINEHSALLGLWARTGRAFRASFDLELLSADESFTRISPRQMQRYKLRLNYTPAEWATISGAVNIQEARNNIVDILHKRHNRSYGLALVMMPNDRFALDIGYDFSDIFSQTNICYTIGTGPLPPGSGPCPTGGGLISGISLYDDDAHFVHFDWMVRPFRRLETRIGYAVTTTDGVTTFLQPNSPLGPLNITYHLPTASLAFDLTRSLTWKAGWNYYNYDEGGPVDPTGSRNFRANLITVSLRYTTTAER